MLAGFRGYVRLLEAELHRGLQGPGIALRIGNSDAMPPGPLDPEIDKRHRAPDQIGMRQVEFLVVGAAARGLDVEGVDVGMMYAEIDGRAQLRRPPVLVTGSCAPGEDRGAGDRRVVQPAVGGKERPAAEAVEGLAGEHPP